MRQRRPESILTEFDRKRIAKGAGEAEMWRDLSAAPEPSAVNPFLDTTDIQNGRRTKP
jgi:hypothetical protein